LLQIPVSKAADKRHKRLRLFSQCTGALAALVGSVVLIGWASDLSVLKQLLPGVASMKANSAAAFILAGVALGFHCRDHADLRAKRIAQVIALLVALVGLLTLSEYLSGMDLRIDQLLARDFQVVATHAPGRMSPITAVCFATFGLAIAVWTNRVGRMIAEMLALVVVLLSLSSVLGYLLEVKALTVPGAYETMTLHTALLLMCLSVGFYLAHTELGTTAVLADDTLGGAMARTLLPVAIIVPITAVWVVRLCERASFVSSDLGVSLVVVILMTILSAVILWNARSLSNEERQRLQSVEELRVANELLAQMVADKSKEVLIRESLLQEAYEKLQQLSVLDSLTGIANRRGFDEILMREWRLSARNRQPISLIMIDVDHFKTFNDHYGHQTGDDCLRQLAAEIVKGLARPSDVAARYGGEEFVVVLPNTPTAGALAVAKELRARVEALAIQHIESPTGLVTISLGVASSEPGERLSATDLLKAADNALYCAKRAGRNRVEIASIVYGDTGRQRTLNTAVNL
jgi:diguanylate cyclase (GGDEF)-like protein